LVASDPAVRSALEKELGTAERNPRDARFVEELRFALHPPATSNDAHDVAGRPASDDEWHRALAGAGDVKSGRRVFFNPAVGCSRCHRIEGRGGQVGPDLSVVAIASGREKLIQSILHPSLDIAPQFVTHEITARDQQTYSGILAGIEADGTVTLMTADGKGMLIPGKEVVSNVPSKTSLMPEGLANALTVQDFRDLLAFLLSRK
jgi:putative heme-binding domain-containing protein